MKNVVKNIWKAVVFLFLFLLVFFIPHNTMWFQTWQLERAAEKGEATKVILGDSATQSLFTPLQDRNPNYCMLGTSEGVTLAGQYLLLDEYLNSNPQTTDVFLVLRPQSFSTYFSTESTYCNVVVPYTLYGHIEKLSDRAWAELYEVYPKIVFSKTICQRVYENEYAAKLILNILDSGKQVEYTSNLTICDLAEEYLYEIIGLCDRNNVRLHLVAMPIADIPEYHEWTEFNRQVKERELAEVLNPYLDTVIYLPENEFKDGIHFDSEKDNSEFLDMMVKKSGCFEDLVY